MDPEPGKPRRGSFPYSAALCALPAFASAIAGPTAWPPCALPAARSFAAAGVAFSRTADCPAALAFLAAAHRRFVAAMIRARPSGIRRRFFLAAFAGAGGAVAACLAFRAAAQRFLRATAMRRRAAGLTMRLGAAVAAAGARGACGMALYLHMRGKTGL